MTEKNQQDFEFELPIGYEDEDGVLHKTASLHKMTGRDEAIMADKNNRHNGARMITELLGSCVTQLGTIKKPGREVARSLFSADRHFLLIKLREITFGPDMQATYSCPTCSQSTSVTEDLSTLEVVRLGDDERPDEISVQLEDGYEDKDGQVHRIMNFRYSIGTDEEKIGPTARQNASLGKNALLARCITSVGNMEKKRVQALGTAIFRDLTMGDRAEIDRVLNTQGPGAKMRHIIDCDGCSRQFEVSLDMSNFLAPSSVERAA